MAGTVNFNRQIDLVYVEVTETSYIMLFDLDIFIAKLRGSKEVEEEFLRSRDGDLLLPIDFEIFKLLLESIFDFMCNLCSF